MTYNADLLREIADKIEADPQYYYQGAWSARVVIDEATGETDYEGGPRLVAEEGKWSYCIAGWAMHLSGWSVGPDGDWHNPDGERRYLSFQAEGARLLGLGFYEGSRLFAGDWKPKEGMTVPEALRALADGQKVYEVSRSPYD